MLKASYLVGFILVGILLAADPANAQPIKTANRVAYTGSSGDVSYFVGIDYRLEIVQLVANWYGDEDPQYMTPIQMHPLRQALLDEMEPWRDHEVLSIYQELWEKHNLGPPVKLTLNAGSIPELDTERDWFSYMLPASQLLFGDQGEFNADLSAWFTAVNSFIEESGIIDFFEEHEDEYLEVARELYAATENGQVIDRVLAQLDFPDAELYILASPMITPGRNYASYFHAENPDRLKGYYYLGPYKQVDQGLLRYPSWSEVPVTFDDTKQFIQLSVHEMAHMLLGDALQKAVGERSGEYVELLTPLEATLGDSYGPLPDRAHKYIDELVTRAYTLDVIRTFVGEADFRQMIAEELPFTRGHALLMWKHLHETLAESKGAITLDALMGGIPAAMSSWTEDDLRPFNTYNEYSMTLRGFFGEFIPMFYPDNHSSFALAFDDELPQAWRDEFTALLSKRLGVPDDIQVLDNPGECPFVIKVCVDTPAEFGRQLGFSGFSMADVEEMSRDAMEEPLMAPLVICKEPSETGAVDVTWHILRPGVPPSTIVPYYFVSVTHMLSVAGEPVVFDSLTEETRQVTVWIVD